MSLHIHFVCFVRPLLMCFSFPRKIAWNKKEQNKEEGRTVNNNINEIYEEQRVDWKCFHCYRHKCVRKYVYFHHSRLFSIQSYFRLVFNFFLYFFLILFIIIIFFSCIFQYICLSFDAFTFSGFSFCTFHVQTLRCCYLFFPLFFMFVFQLIPVLVCIALVNRNLSLA